MSSSLSNQKGFTLVELMMGLLIVTIAFTALGNIFSAIAKAILVNKTKTIAVNLAQEKIESLKNLSYFRLLVTTTTTTDSNFPGMVYDLGTTQSYYPEETLNVGGVAFKRRTLVEFVSEISGSLESEPWTSNDTGIKKISVYVVWREGDDWKKVEINNLRHNPNRAQLEYSFTGTVTSGTTGSPIYNAVVDTLQNPAYTARTDANGSYSFKVQPGTYTLRATATGYFTAISTNYVVNTNDTGSSTKNFQLSLMGVGKTTGYAYIRDHLVITQVVASTNTGNDNGWEWVELYNPTTYNILIASRAGPASAWDVFNVTVTYICSNDDEPPDSNGSHPARYLLGNDSDLDFTFRSTSTHWTANTTTVSIPSNHFFLIANVSTINAVNSNTAVYRIADAYYYSTSGYDPASPVNIIQAGDDGGIRVTGSQGYAYNSRTDWHDGFAWGGNTASKAMENSGNTNDLDKGEIFHRVAYKFVSGDCYDTQTQSFRVTSPFAANAFDSNKNGVQCGNGSDFDFNSAISFYLTASSSIANADVTMPPYTGTPAVGAAVSSNDGLSSVSYVQSYGSFTVVNMATGTWIVTISSGNYTRDISDVVINTNISTGIPNNSTSPTWEFSSLSFSAAALSSTTIYGYVSGIVRDAQNSPFSGVTVAASGANSVTTDSQGKYRLNVVPSGSPISIEASKSGYSTEIVPNIGIVLGVEISTVNFTLVSAGSVRGFITTNGAASGALPGIPVVAYNESSTTILGSAITKSDGSFLIESVTTGTVIVQPQLETGETSSPSSAMILVTAVSTGTWSSTFTVTNAFGEITGTVGVGGSTDPITTGVLLIASTSTITSETPPAVNSSLRSASVVYYSVSSDASGRYTLPLRGSASYYIYGWYPTSLSVSISSAPKRQALNSNGTCPNCFWVDPGGSTSVDLSW